MADAAGVAVSSPTRTDEEIEKIAYEDDHLRPLGFVLSHRGQPGTIGSTWSQARSSYWAPIWQKNSDNSALQLVWMENDPVPSSYEVHRSGFKGRRQISEHTIARIEDVWDDSPEALVRLVDGWYQIMDGLPRPAPWAVPLPIAIAADAMGLVVAGVQRAGSPWSVALYPADPEQDPAPEVSAYLEEVGMHRLGRALWVGLMTEAGGFQSGPG